MYCARVMGWEFKVGVMPDTYYGKKEFGWTEINPYDDLNQMAEVVEKLIDKSGCILQIKSDYVTDCLINIKQDFRDFIISTMGDSDK